MKKFIAINKCFKNKNYEDIYKIAPNFPGIIGYYGMQ